LNNQKDARTKRKTKEKGSSGKRQKGENEKCLCSLFSCFIFLSGQRIPWTSPEKKIVAEEMKDLMLKKGLPGKLECNALIRKHPCLSHRPWTSIKDYCRNNREKILFSEV
jgi:hypothetical protein